MKLNGIGEKKYRWKYDGKMIERWWQRTIDDKTENVKTNGLCITNFTPIVVQDSRSKVYI